MLPSRPPLEHIAEAINGAVKNVNVDGEAQNNDNEHVQKDFEAAAATTAQDVQEPQHHRQTSTTTTTIVPTLEVVKNFKINK